MPNRPDPEPDRQTVHLKVHDASPPARTVRIVALDEEQHAAAKALSRRAAPDAAATSGAWRAIAAAVPKNPVLFVAHDGAMICGFGATAPEALAAGRSQMDTEMRLHSLEPADTLPARVDECTPALARAVRGFAGAVEWRTLDDGKLGTSGERDDEERRHVKAQCLAAAGRALFGAEWISPMAAELGVALRTVQRWAAEVCAVPDRVLYGDLPALAARAIERGVVRELEARAATIRTLARAGEPASPVPDMMDLVKQEQAEKAAREERFAQLSARR